MNLYQFFQKVALRSLDVDSLNGSLLSRMENEVAGLADDYRKGNKVDYSCPFRRAAYVLCYAPRHALYWRQIALSRGYRGQMMLAFNSYGTGPGSEVIGFLEGLNWTQIETPEGDFEKEGAYVDCKEAEEGWRDVLEIVSEEYEVKTNRQVVFTSSNETRLLRPHSLTLGSFVLSDLARQGQLSPVLEELHDTLKPSLALFLDASKFTKPDGSEEYVSRAIPVNFDRRYDAVSLSLKDACNAEMSGCSPLHCCQPLRFEPSLNLFAIRFP